MVQRVINTSVKIGETTAYFTPEIIESDYSILEGFMVQNEYLRTYEKQFKDLQFNFFLHFENLEFTIFNFQNL